MMIEESPYIPYDTLYDRPFRLVSSILSKYEDKEKINSMRQN